MTRLLWRTALLLSAIVVVGAAAVAGTVWLARANGFSARTPPTAPERLIARTLRRWAVPDAARRAVNPVPFTPEVWAEARAHFADHCATCHANNGSGDTEIGRGLYPPAPDMRLPGTQALTDGEIYWIIENGIRLTGMPAWGEGGGNDLDTWKLVHFIRHLKDLTPEQLTEMSALNPKTPAEIQEEQEDERFLAGETPAPEPAPPHRH